MFIKIVYSRKQILSYVQSTALLAIVLYILDRKI